MAILAAVLVGFMSSAFGASATNAKVGVLLKSRVGYWNKVENAARSTASRLGVEVIVKGGNDLGNVGVQDRLFDALLEQHVDVIVISPIVPARLRPRAESARSAGVKLVVIDTPEWESIADSYVDIDRAGMVTATSNLLASLSGGEGELAMLRHAQTDIGVSKREDLIIEKLHESCPKLVVRGDVYASSTPGEEQQRAAFLLSKYPNAKLVFASATPGTVGMLRALKATPHVPGMHFVGFGTNLSPEAENALASDVMDAWVAQLPNDLGAKCIETAVDLARHAAAPKRVQTGFIIVTKANLHDASVNAIPRDE